MGGEGRDGKEEEGGKKENKIGRRRVKGHGRREKWEEREKQRSIQEGRVKKRTIYNCLLEHLALCL